ncbi:MAG: beta-ketoacyl synthase chain length factor [Bacteroidales bacterium]|nr:beta-ketoacyl synthase chain length factor [Bacteroidales bacterium]
MIRKVYIRSFCVLKPGAPDPDFKPLLTMMEARRMTPLMKRAVYTASQALAGAALACPQAIICGTQWGCLVNTEAFFAALHGLDDRAPSPTHFMQSTHNTLASLLGIRLKCHGYNATYSHSEISFESALLDAFLQIRSGALDNALVGAYEEMPPFFAEMFRVQADLAAAFVLSASPQDALAVLEDVQLMRGKPACGAPDPAALSLSEVLPCSGTVELHGGGEGRSQSLIRLCGN